MTATKAKPKRTRAPRNARAIEPKSEGVRRAELAIRAEAPKAIARLSTRISQVCNLADGSPVRRVDASRGNLLELLTNAQNRVKFTHPGARGVQLCEYFEQAKHQAEQADFRKEVAALREAARDMHSRDGDQARMKLAEIYKVSTLNWMQATSNWSSFFQIHDLADDDVPYLESRVPMEVGIQSIGADGVPTELQAVKRQGQAPVPLGILSTPEFVYQIMDVYKGFQVKEDSLALIDMSRDMQYQIDALTQQMLLVGSPTSRLKASFVTTGTERLRDYYAHSRIDTANFPDGNLIVLDSNTATSNIRKEVLDAIINYCQAWGNNVWADGADLRPINLILPSSHAAGWLTSVEISNTQSGIGHTNPVVEQVFQNGQVLSYGGYQWNILSDNTLSPDSPYCYVQMNKPVGHLFFKPGLSRIFTDNSPAMLKENKESVFMTRVWGSGFLSNEVPHMMAVKYRD